MNKLLQIFLVLICLNTVIPAFASEGESFRSPLVQRFATDGWDIELLDTGKDAEYLDNNEKDVLMIMNACRHNPSKFAEIYVKEYMGFIEGRYLKRPGEITIALNEGMPPVKELYNQMKASKTREVLTPSFGMSFAAEDHVVEQGPTGNTGHYSSDGTDPFERMNRYGRWLSTAGENISYGYNNGLDIVLQLMVDDGVSSRGHRKNIMAEKFHNAGIAIGEHQRYRFMCVIDYAGGYKEDMGK